jgi:hypothetical protein
VQGRTTLQHIKHGWFEVANYYYFCFQNKFLLENAVAAFVAGSVAGLLPHRVQAFRCELLIRNAKTGDRKWVADFQHRFAEHFVHFCTDCS